MSIVADVYQFVVGVDTHAASHTFAVVKANSGASVDNATFPATAAALKRAITWIDSRACGPTLIVVEGIGSYGAKFADAAVKAGYVVVEPFPTPTRVRRGHGKTDQMDAAWIGGSVLGVDVDKLRQPRSSQAIREALRVLTVARDLMNVQRTATINQLTALVRVADLGIDTRKPLSGAQVSQIAAWHTPTRLDPACYARREAHRLARHIHDHDKELADNERHLRQLVAASPQAFLLNLFGVGPIVAATIIVAWSHPGRVRSEAAFAALAGVNPIPASSGNTIRHRLNRGGDRRLNKALGVIVRTRLAMDPATREYHAKRTAEGLTSKEIQRVLKRYVARQIFRQLTANTI